MPKPPVVPDKCVEAVRCAVMGDLSRDCCGILSGPCVLCLRKIATACLGAFLADPGTGDWGMIRRSTFGHAQGFVVENKRTREVIDGIPTMEAAVAVCAALNATEQGA